MRYRAIVLNRRQFKIGKVASEITGTECKPVASRPDREFGIHIGLGHLSVYFWCIPCFDDIPFRREYFWVFFQRHKHPFCSNMSYISPGTLCINIVVAVTTYWTASGK